MGPECEDLTLASCVAVHLHLHVPPPPHPHPVAPHRTVAATSAHLYHRYVG